jgi:hypothetical protein
LKFARHSQIKPQVLLDLIKYYNSKTWIYYLGFLRREHSLRIEEMDISPGLNLYCICKTLLFCTRFHGANHKPAFPALGFLQMHTSHTKIILFCDIFFMYLICPVAYRGAIDKRLIVVTIALFSTLSSQVPCSL